MAADHRAVRRYILCAISVFRDAKGLWRGANDLRFEVPEILAIVIGNAASIAGCMSVADDQFFAKPFDRLSKLRCALLSLFWILRVDEWLHFRQHRRHWSFSLRTSVPITGSLRTS